MKKSTTISLVLVIVMFAAAVFVLASKQAGAPDNNQQEQPNQNQTNELEEKLQDQNASQAGKYIEYDETELANSKNDNYLFFHAPWCPQCRSIEASINRGGHIPKNVTIYKLDYDSNQELRKKYGVTLQTTFVKVDNQGNFIDKYVAYESPSIGSVVENFINK